MRIDNLWRAAPVLALLLLAAPVLAAEQGESVADTVLSAKVGAAILGFPRYGPYDLISYGVRDGVVTLTGEVYQATLQGEAERTVRAIPGVKSVVNSIEVLPLSKIDDRLRHAVFARIYRDGFLSKYGTPVGRLGHGAFGPVGTPGTREPLGRYAIHVVVKDGRVTLYGLVDNPVDRDRAEFDARGVFGVMSVENRIEVLSRGPAA